MVIFIFSTLISSSTKNVTNDREAQEEDGIDDILKQVDVNESVEQEGATSSTSNCTRISVK